MYNVLESHMHTKRMCVQNSNATPGTPIVMQDRQWGVAAQQLFYMQLVDQNRFWIRSALNPQMVMEVNGSAPGTPVVLNNSKTPPLPQQLFKWNGDKIETCVGAFVLEIQKQNPNNGASVVLGESFLTNCNHQRWKASFQ